MENTRRAGKHGGSHHHSRRLGTDEEFFGLQVRTASDGKFPNQIPNGRESSPSRRRRKKRRRRLRKAGRRSATASEKRAGVRRRGGGRLRPTEGREHRSRGADCRDKRADGTGQARADRGPVKSNNRPRRSHEQRPTNADLSPRSHRSPVVGTPAPHKSESGRHGPEVEAEELHAGPRRDTSQQARRDHSEGARVGRKRNKTHTGQLGGVGWSGQVGGLMGFNGGRAHDFPDLPNQPAQPYPPRALIAAAVDFGQVDGTFHPRVNVSRAACSGYFRVRTRAPTRRCRNTRLFLPYISGLSWVRCCSRPRACFRC